MKQSRRPGEKTGMRKRFRISQKRRKIMNEALAWNVLCFMIEQAHRCGLNRVHMRMIQPNCRVQFAAEDIEFILSVLGCKVGTEECLVKLLADEDSRDLILDDEALLHALL